jgi:hypothetical protein
LKAFDPRELMGTMAFEMEICNRVSELKALAPHPQRIPMLPAGAVFQTDTVL